jgi:hypothetical protein
MMRLDYFKAPGEFAPWSNKQQANMYISALSLQGVANNVNSAQSATLTEYLVGTSLQMQMHSSNCASPPKEYHK